VAFYAEEPVVEPERASSRIATLLVLPLTVTLAILILVFFGIWQPITVLGDSMLPTLRPQDHILITHGYPDPRRGDVVVLRAIERAGAEDLAKRVVAVGGDTVQVRAGIAYVNGHAEPTSRQVISTGDDLPMASATVPLGTVFVLGDNRPVSMDSRIVGPVPLTGVLGRCVAVFAPVTRLRLIRREPPA
jgi:signal peptidase I